MQNLIIIRWLLLIFCALLTAMLVYQSWMNLIQGKLSKFSIDGLSMWIISMISNEWCNKVIGQFENNPHSIHIIGIYALVGSIASLFVSIEILSSLLITQ
jgi:hypothetical protein